MLVGLLGSAVALLAVAASGIVGAWAVLVAVVFLVVIALVVAILTDDPDREMRTVWREDVRHDLRRRPQSSTSVTKSMRRSTAPTNGGKRSA